MVVGCKCRVVACQGGGRQTKLSGPDREREEGSDAIRIQQEGERSESLVRVTTNKQKPTPVNSTPASGAKSPALPVQLEIYRWIAKVFSVSISVQKAVISLYFFYKRSSRVLSRNHGRGRLGTTLILESPSLLRPLMRSTMRSFVFIYLILRFYSFLNRLVETRSG
jgi:hypothetical protein